VTSTRSLPHRAGSLERLDRYKLLFITGLLRRLLKARVYMCYSCLKTKQP